MSVAKLRQVSGQTRSALATLEPLLGAMWNTTLPDMLALYRMGVADTGRAQGLILKIDRVWQSKLIEVPYLLLGSIVVVVLSVLALVHCRHECLRLSSLVADIRSHSGAVWCCRDPLCTGSGRL